jgi:hypothetical protein
MGDGTKAPFMGMGALEIFRAAVLSGYDLHQCRCKSVGELRLHPWAQADRNQDDSYFAPFAGRMTGG